MSKMMLRREQLRPALADSVDITAATERGRVTVVGGEQNREDNRKRCAHIARRVLESRVAFRFRPGAHIAFRPGAHIAFRPGAHIARGVLV